MPIEEIQRPEEAIDHESCSNLFFFFFGFLLVCFTIVILKEKQEK